MNTRSAPASEGIRHPRRLDEDVENILHPWNIEEMTRYRRDL
jgi:hypothetical protein